MSDAPRETMRDILHEVAARHGIGIRDLIAEGRHRAVAWPRQEAMWEVRKRTRLSLPQIGRGLGGRDHTTILHGIRRHEERTSLAQCEAGQASQP